MPLPSSRDPEALRSSLGKWLSHEIGGPVTVGPLGVPDGAGYSSETYLFDADWDGTRHGLVCRMAPEAADMPVFPSYDLALQVRAMSVVRRQAPAVPVPKVLWHETDPSHLGDEFYVMERVAGRGAPDNPPYVFGSWVTEATPQQRRIVQDHCADLMAGIHAIKVDSATREILTRPRWGDTPLDQHLNHQRWYYDWARGDLSFPLIETALVWLDANRPPDDPVGVNWGDARIGNILFDTEGDLHPIAVVDWEMACLGAPEADVTWQLMLHHFFLDIADVMGMGNPCPGFFDGPEFVGRYEATSGRKLQNLEWYYVFAHLRFAIITLRTSRRAIATGDMAPSDDPQDLINNRRILEAALSGSNPYWDL